MLFIVTLLRRASDLVIGHVDDILGQKNLAPPLDKTNKNPLLQHADNKAVVIKPGNPRRTVSSHLADHPGSLEA